MTESAYQIDRIALHFRTMGFPLLLLLMAAAAACAFWYYRKTIPPVSGWMKRAVVGLRSLAMIVLIIGLAEPVVHIVMTITRHDVVAVLFDTSSSMNIPEDPQRKQDALDALEKIQSIFGTTGAFFTFDNEIRPLETTEPSFNGAATDILSAVKNAGAQKDVSTIVLISDGKWNLGEDPAGSGLPAAIPVHTVQVGSSEQVKEVVLKHISVSPIGHEGSRLPVEIVVTSTVESTEPVPVEVMESNRTVSSGSVSFTSGTQARITLDIPLEQPGYHRFTAKINPSDDRLETNNTRFFGVNVLKSSFRILMVAKAPSADLAFIRRVIDSDEAFDLHVVIDKGIITTSEHAYPDDITDFDAVILVDGGGSVITPGRAESLIKLVSKGSGLWLIGSSPLEDGVSVLGDIVPVTLTQSAQRLASEFFIELTETGRAHFITSGIEGMNGEGGWVILPPLTSILPISHVSPSGRVLANTSGTSSQVNPLPVIVTGRYNAGKVLVIPVSGIWRWRLMMEGAGKTGSFFTAFVLGTLRWLTSDTETSPLAITTDSRSYLSGQEIGFEGRLFDNIYMPVSGAEISLVIDSNPTLKVFLDETAPAIYKGSIGGMGAGKHGFKAVAFLEDRQFAEASGTFQVEEFSLEMLDYTPDPDLLGTIAAHTGGISVTSAGVDSLINTIHLRYRTERQEQDHHLYLSPFMPVLIILLFAVEWGIRKRRGMI